MDPDALRNPPSHSDRVEARKAANIAWPKRGRSWIDHLFYVWAESDTRDTMPEGPGE